jgi:hypothetical protein
VPRSSKWSLPFKFSKHFVCIFHPSHACYLPCPSYSPWFDHSNNIWWSIQVTKLPIMQSSPALCHFLPLRANFQNLCMAVEVRHLLLMTTENIQN